MNRYTRSVSGETPLSWTHVVVVGIRYPELRERLSFSTKDAKAVADMFERIVGGENNRLSLTLLFDDDIAVAKPDRDTIRRALRDAVDSAEKDDRLVFFYAGHGVKNEVGEAVLVACGGRSLHDASAHLSLAEVRSIVAGGRAKESILIIDACHSGEAGRFDIAAREYAGTMADERSEGWIAWLLLCGENEVSLEDNDSGHGLFTQYLLEAITDNADVTDVNYDGLLSLPEIHTYVSQAITSHIFSKKKKRDAAWMTVAQTPRAGAPDKAGGGEIVPGAVVLFPLLTAFVSPDAKAAELFARALERVKENANTYECGTVRLHRDSGEALCEAIELLRKSVALENLSEENQADLYFWLGRLLYENGPCQDVKQARKWLEKAEGRGHVEALVYLGHCYLKGRGGFPYDPGQAVNLYQRAADKNNANASFCLARVLLQDGRSRLEKAQGIKYLRDSANLRHAEAEFELGRRLFSGEGVTQSEQAVFTYFIRSARQGYRPAQEQVARCYQYGWGEAANQEQARYWREMARMTKVEAVQ